MSQSKTPKQNTERGTAAKKKKQNQTKQLIWMAVILAVCAVMVTWTVMLMRERFAENDILNEQRSNVDIWEMSSAEDSEDSTQTAVPEFTEKTVTTTTVTTDTETTTTTTLTNATAPPKVSVQDPHLVKFSTKKPTQTTSAKPSGGGTTHTEPQGVPENSPSGSEIAYSRLLALYLGVQNRSGSAYFADGIDDAEPTVVLHGTGAYYVVSAANDFGTYNPLGGTGGTEEHPWQTDSPFRIYQYDEDSRYLYYSSQGNNYEVIGYFDPATCENVWARLHYYQLGVGWQAEYHINHCNRPDSLNGTQSELYSGTFDVDALYTLSEDFMQTLVEELHNRDMSIGTWANYKEISANAQTDAIRGKAGSYNAGFAPQSGDTYGVVASGSATVTLRDASGASVAVLPEGALLSIPAAALPLGSGATEVSAQVNGTWKKGYLDGASILVWSDH